MPSTLIAERPRIARSSRVDTFRKDRLRSALIIVWLAAAGWAFLYGIDYYLTPLADRPARTDHAELAPAGTLGSLYALAGGAMVVLGVGAYAIRKRTRLLGRLGTMRSWLYVHTFLCTLGAFFLLLHTAFDVSGLSSVLTAYLAVVVGSGVSGRFVYQWIPKTAHGRFLTPEELGERRERLRTELIRVAACSPEQAAVWLGPPLEIERATPASAFVASLEYSLSRRLRKSRLTTTLRYAGIKGKRNSEAARLILTENRIQAQLALLPPFQRLFARWHRMHLYLVGALAVAVAIHAVVAVTRG